MYSFLFFHQEAQEDVNRRELKEKAQTDLADWYARREQQLDKTKKNNRFVFVFCFELSS